jgi:uncharacterized protein YdhG (YjbR/CyaY superfamily)
MPKHTSVDEYLAALPDDRRAPMQQLRETIRAATPEADEVITYNMPGFRLDGRFFVSYDAFKQHYSRFPASQAVIDALGHEVAPHVAGRGTLRFAADRPLPLDLIARIIAIRLTEHAT